MENELITPFIEGVSSVIEQMADIEVKIDNDILQEGNEIVSLGIGSIITFSGTRHKGRMLLDMEPEVAINIARNMTGEDYESTRDDMVMAGVSELNNMIAGAAITFLNNEHSAGIRLAPPIVLTGSKMIIAIPKTSSASIIGVTKHGKIKMNIAMSEGV